MVKNAWDALASDYPTEIKKGFSVGESRGLSNLEGITNLFIDRYDKIKEIFITQSGFHPSGTIKEIKKEFHIINVIVIAINYTHMPYSFTSTY